MLSSRRFLESLLIIMSSPIFYEPALFATIRDMMFFLLDDEKGEFASQVLFAHLVVFFLCSVRVMVPFSEEYDVIGF